MRVFDVENVNGAPVLLYETTPAACDAGIDCEAALLTQVLSSGEAGEVDRINTFEGGWGGLSLARNG